MLLQKAVTEDVQVSRIIGIACRSAPINERHEVEVRAGAGRPVEFVSRDIRIAICRP